MTICEARAAAASFGFDTFSSNNDQRVLHLIHKVSQLGAAAQKYQSATQNASSNVSVSELQNNCNLFVTSARQLAKALEVPLVNDLGYTKRYVRCLQVRKSRYHIQKLMAMGVLMCDDDFVAPPLAFLTRLRQDFVLNAQDYELTAEVATRFHSTPLVDI
nr:Transcriptional corepressor SEUSS [Ipomoea batatas]